MDSSHSAAGHDPHRIPNAAFSLPDLPGEFMFTRCLYGTLFGCILIQIFNGNMIPLCVRKFKHCCVGFRALPVSQQASRPEPSNTSHSVERKSSILSDLHPFSAQNRPMSSSVCDFCSDSPRFVNRFSASPDRACALNSGCRVHSGPTSDVCVSWRMTTHKQRVGQPRSNRR